MTTDSKITATKLQNPEYRKAFVASQINIGIPFQVRSMMKHKGWTQEQLADRAGMLQPRISAILKPGKGRLNIETLRRLAEAFDCGLFVRFASFGELFRWSEEFDPESFNVSSFENDSSFKEANRSTRKSWSRSHFSERRSTRRRRKSPPDMPQMPPGRKRYAGRSYEASIGRYPTACDNTLGANVVTFNPSSGQSGAFYGR